MLIKPKQLHVGDKVAIVSLSAGTLGESFASHELKQGIKHMKQLGLNPVFMPHALSGSTYVKSHPAERVADLKAAFLDPEIKGIFAAIGGDDTYRTLPYLMADQEFKTAVFEHPKLFSGFSDTTNNHLMFYKMGLQTFYGPSFLTDFAELANKLLPYTKKTLVHYFENPPVTLIPASQNWYEERTDFSIKQVGKERISHKDTGYEVLRGHGKVQGRLWGGCIDSLYDDLVPDRYPDEPSVINQYQLILTPEEAKDKILFIETCEEKPVPELYHQELAKLEEVGILGNVRAILVGKPQDKKYFGEYKQILLEETAKFNTPILYNVNIGHAYPRTALPYGTLTQINFEKPEIKIMESWFA